MKFSVLLFFISFSMLITNSSSAQSKDETAIRKILSAQSNDWNAGNVEAFMSGYWKSDSLMFIGKNGINYGWDKTLANYKKGYPDTVSMGKLSFDLLEFKRLSDTHYFVVGKWHLKRSIGDIGGAFTLVFRKINGKWLIIADHSS